MLYKEKEETDFKEARPLGGKYQKKNSSF